MIDPFKSIEHFIEVEKQMTELKLASISTQMNAVYSSIAEVQNRFNDYYNSVQQNSEQMNNQQSNPVDASNNESNSENQNINTEQTQQPSEEQEYIEAEPTIAVNTSEQIKDTKHEIESVIHSLNHSLANIQHFIDNKKLTAAFRKELKSATEKLSESLNEVKATTDSDPTSDTTTPKS